MKDLYFIYYNQNIYDINGEIICVIGSEYIVDRTRSDLIGEKSGKFINIRSKEDIDKFKKIINKNEVINRTNDLEISGLKSVTKEENGQIKNYIVTKDGQIYDDNNSFLNFNEKRKILLMEWLEDPIKSSRIAVMTPEELDEELMNVIKIEYKEYSFDDANKLDKDDEKKRLASEKASEVDGRVNGELGIVENGTYDTYEYSTIEQRGDGYVVVNPSVVSKNLKSTEIISSGAESSNEVVNTEEEVQIREMEEEKYFYIEYDSNNNVQNIYDSNGNKLEDIDPQYVVVAGEVVLYQGQQLGKYGGTVNDLSQLLAKAETKGNVRVLEKKNNAGFGQIMVVALVLLCLAMFIGVIVLSLLG